MVCNSIGMSSSPSVRFIENKTKIRAIFFSIDRRMQECFLVCCLFVVLFVCCFVLSVTYFPFWKQIRLFYLFRCCGYMSFLKQLGRKLSQQKLYTKTRPLARLRLSLIKDFVD